MGPTVWEEEGPMPMRSRSKTLSGRAAEAAAICPARKAAGASAGSAGVAGRAAGVSGAAGRAAVSRSRASAGAPASVLAVMAESCRADPASAS